MVHSRGFIQNRAPNLGVNTDTGCSSRSNGCTPYIPLTALKNGRLSLGKRAANYQCHARCISHVDERNYRYENWTSLPSSEIFTCDIIETLCVSGFRTEGFLHSQIYEHPPDDNANDGTLPNVYIIIIDSVSSSMAKRSLSKSISFLKERMGGTLMEFLNRVGVNSKPNGFPLIFGKSIEAVNRDTVAAPSSIEDWNEPVICREFLDKYDHHLKQFKFYGYKTMIAQDGGAGIAFYPNCSGFKRTEADHMWRYEIGQIWPTLLAHDSLKNLYHADEQFLTFFKNNEKVLENAFVFFMGDHGPRGEGIATSALGYHELNNPFLIATLPKRYHNTNIHNRMREKSNQLMTNFDLHATLMDIMNLSKSGKQKDKKTKPN
ncbi:hypothetical protein DICVIV_11524 [Dictyocaulus viviparus]|uniref:Sulfatase N-terminal domain-containing protein n=1 Tax=Dictyocaulus viviparus TaxID=29172 RepID=A0A0D8XFJ0_DICVI|nr:hypothetical protein DICVIV_11524 [Dictyocaulus viviparus]